METKYENKCRVKFFEMLETVERTSGYSHSQVLSVMVVMECTSAEAREMLDTYSEFQDIDWSEASWAEMRDAFASIHNSKQVAH